MNLNQYLAFAAAPSANTLTFLAYETLLTLIADGFQPGVASSQHMNTVLRQTTTAAGALGQFAADNGTLDAIDNGDPDLFALAIKSAVLELIKSNQFVKPGMVMANLGVVLPDGFLACSGQNVSRTTYAALWTALGSPNTGDGFSTFTVPDLRGEFLRGWDNARGVDAGRVLGSPQNQDVQPHTHSNNWQMAFEGGSATNDRMASGSSLESAYFTLPTGNNAGTETRPRNVAVHYIIKY